MEDTSIKYRKESESKLKEKDTKIQRLTKDVMDLDDMIEEARGLI